jgi:hypothetical protein
MSLQAQTVEHYRRNFLTSAASGTRLTALTALLSEEWLRNGGGRLQAAQPFADSSAPASPTQLANALAEKIPHFAPKAKNCIFLLQAGAPSQLDLFEPKPRLNELHGQPYPKKCWIKSVSHSSKRSPPC